MELRKKEFKFKGMNLEDLQKLNVREFAKYLRSRERRTINRQFQAIEQFVEKAKTKNTNDKKIKTHIRDLIIVPELVGMNIQIYNGNTFIPVQVTGEMLGHKFGEFAPTRKRINHGSAGVGSTKGSKHKSKK